MLKNIILFTAVLFLSLFFSKEINAQNLTIKSLKVYSGDDQTAFPIILPNGEGPKDITIEFDIQSQNIPNLKIVFKYCDQNWNPTNNIFLLNTGNDVSNNLEFEKLPTLVQDADYHFSGKFPNSRKGVSFPFSGKWKFFITDFYDTSKVFASGKFFVVYNEVPLNVTKKNEQLEDKTYFPKDLANIFNITTEFNLPQQMYPDYVDHVEIIENHKIDFPIIVDRKFNSNTRQYYWDANRNFRFTARDIRPGNEYRQVDLRNYNKYNSKNVQAQFNGIEYSRFFKEGPPDLNGGSILLNYKDKNADYLNVTFSIRIPSEVSGDVFLTGAFNNWELSKSYRMENRGGVYKLTIPLKRGIYDYQYVLADFINNKIENADWYVLEGNSWETSNVYEVFLYYKDPNYGGYDKIIGYQKIITK